jgi:hypothetical protein
MPEDLKQQANELYKEHTDSLPTSESLSTRRLTFISVLIVLVLVVVIQALGGLSSKRAPVKQAVTRPLPPEPEPAEPPLTTPAQAAQPAAPPVAVTQPPAVAHQLPVSSPPKAKRAPDPTPPPPVSAKAEALPVGTAEARPVLRRQATSSPIAEPTSRGETKTEPAATPPPEPSISPVELARQELARDIVVGKVAALAKMITEPAANLDYRGWKSDPAGTDVYHVTFTFQDKSSGTSLLYVWRVDMNARSIAPLSYYARRLP